MCLHERTAFKVLPCWSVSCQSVFMSCIITDRHIAKNMMWMELLLELQRLLFSRLTCLNVPEKPRCLWFHKNMQKHQHDPLRNITLQYLCGWRHISARSCSMCGPYQNRDKSTSCQMLSRLFTHHRKTSPKNAVFQSGQLPDGTEVGLKGAYISAGLCCCCCCWRLLLLGSSVLAGDGGIWEAKAHTDVTNMKVT